MWNFSIPKFTTYGKGTLKYLTEILPAFGLRPLFVLSQRTLNTKKIIDFFKLLKKHSLKYGISTNTHSEAPVTDVVKILNDYQSQNCDFFVAIGGGSVIDLTKSASILVTNGGKISEYYGLNQVKKPTPPKILIPTTSGTGSEATNIIVLSDKKNKSKKGIVSPYLLADWVVLDPELTYSMSAKLTLNTGLDAFSQCLEAYTSKTCTPLAQMHALKGLKIINDSLIKSISRDKKARDQMSLAAYLSGVAISGGNSGTNIGHAIGNTLGGMFSLPHGLCVATVLEAGVKFNSKSKTYKNRLKELETQLHFSIVNFLTKIKQNFDIPRLSESGIKKSDIPKIAKKVISDQQRLLANNYRQVNQKDIEKILKESF